MASLSQLELLPPEPIEHILGLLPDVTSLLSSILTCSSLYRVFIRMEVPITSKVVRNHINEEVLPEAVASWKSSGLDTWTHYRALQDFCEDHLSPRQRPPSSWTLSEASPLADLHRCVEHLTLDFASWTLRLLDDSDDSDAWLSQSLSSSELYRIQRAFYRFEMYCNLFRTCRLRPVRFSKQRTNDFLFTFTMWENEQLGCIHDYLFRRLSSGTLA